MRSKREFWGGGGGKATKCPMSTTMPEGCMSSGTLSDGRLGSLSTVLKARMLKKAVKHTVSLSRGTLELTCAYASRGEGEGGGGGMPYTQFCRVAGVHASYCMHDGYFYERTSTAF